MTQFKGSKGNWVLVERDDVKYDQPVYEIDTPSTRSVVTIWSGVDIGQEIPEQEKANALLISKAPELLEMLEDIVNYGGVANFDKIKQLIKEATEL